MRKINLINPFFLKNYSKFSRSPAVTKSGTLYWPYPLYYAYLYLTRKGAHCEIYDFSENAETHIEMLKETGAVNVIFSSVPSLENDAAFAEKIKTSGNTVFITGNNTDALGGEIFKGSVDGILIGDIEKAIEEFVFENKRNFITPDGAAFNTPYFNDLNDMPFLYQILEKKNINYKNFFYACSLYPVAVSVARRGCPYGCSFCVSAEDKKMRGRAINNIIEELDGISRTKKFNAVFYEDATFNLNDEFLEEFCRAKIKAENKLPWSANFRVFKDLSRIKLLKEAGLYSVVVGVETFSLRELKELKNTLYNFEDVKKMTDGFVKNGIKVHGCFMTGLPDETEEDIKDKIRKIKKINFDTIQVYPVMAFPGTPFYERYKENLKTKSLRDYLTSAGGHKAVYEFNVPLEKINYYCNLARKKFYLRAGYILKRALKTVLSPKEIKRNFIILKNFWKHIL